MIAKSNVAAIILAAGTSSRMGNVNKLLLTVQGKSIIRWSVENALNSRVNGVWIVVGIDGNKLTRTLKPLEVNILWNNDYVDGMSTSINVGIQNIRNVSDGALILLADQPNLQSATLNRFIEKFEKGHKKIIAGQYRNVIGNPVLFHRSLFHELMKIHGDVGARSVLKGHPEEIEPIAIPKDELLDIDTRKDFLKLQASLEK